MFTQAADYQPPMQNRGSNMSVQQTTHPPSAHGVPPAVGVAMAFIQQSCAAKGPRGFTKCSECDIYDEVIEVDLLGKHEAAFNRACNFMGTFFDSESARIRRQRSFDEATFLQQHGVLLDAMFGGDDLGLEEEDPENYDMMSQNNACESPAAGGEDVHGNE